jgi:hypothetical protein
MKRRNCLWKRNTIEEQFKETLNNEEIDRIEDPELRAILSHWVYRLNILRDEHNILIKNYVDSQILIMKMKRKS